MSNLPILEIAPRGPADAFDRWLDLAAMFLSILAFLLAGAGLGFLIGLCVFY